MCFKILAGIQKPYSKMPMGVWFVRYTVCILIQESLRNVIEKCGKTECVPSVCVSIVQCVCKMCIVIHCARGCSSALFMSNCINVRSFVYTGHTGARVSYDECIRYCFLLNSSVKKCVCVICLYVGCKCWIYKDWTRISEIAK